jgi:phosphate butyryltransferase
MKSFDEIIERAKSLGPKRLAVAGEPGEEFKQALKKAEADGLAYADIKDTASHAVANVTSGVADILIKGGVDTPSFMRAVLDRERGLRSGKLLSHVTVVEGLGRLFLITDGGICMNPTKDEKVSIIENALPIANAIGIAVPKVALLAAVEKVNPKMPETVDAAEIAAQGVDGCLVQGPLAVDNAVDPRAAQAKGIDGPVAGHADILVVPSVLVGNIFAKGIMYFAASRFGGLVAGASKPVVFLSRSDTAETKYNTIALGILLDAIQSGGR